MRFARLHKVAPGSSLIYVAILNCVARYLGSALAYLAVPFIVEHLGPAAEFRCVGMAALAWLALWLSVGSDRTEAGGEDTTSLMADIENNKWGKGDEDALVGNADEQAPFIRGGTVRSTRSRGSPDGKSSSLHFEPGAKPAGSGAGRIPWDVMMQCPAVWAIVTTNFAFHYATYVIMNWLPTYFQNRLAVSLYDMGNVFKVRTADPCLRMRDPPKAGHGMIAVAASASPMGVVGPPGGNSDVRGRRWVGKANRGYCGESKPVASSAVPLTFSESSLLNPRCLQCSTFKHLKRLRS